MLAIFSVHKTHIEACEEIYILGLILIGWARDEAHVFAHGKGHRSELGFSNLVCTRLTWRPVLAPVANRSL